MKPQGFNHEPTKTASNLAIDSMVSAGKVGRTRDNALASSTLRVKLHKNVDFTADHIIQSCNDWHLCCSIQKQKK